MFNRLDGEVHLINYCIEETYKEKLSQNLIRIIHTNTRDAKGKEDLPIESQVSEWMPLLSKLLMELR